MHGHTLDFTVRVWSCLPGYGSPAANGRKRTMEIITTREQLVALAARLRVRPDWHEPDERGLSARVEGTDFDNAGFWPARPDVGTTEMHVLLSVEDAVCDLCDEDEDHDHDSVVVAAVNLASLLAWASQAQ